MIWSDDLEDYSDGVTHPDGWFTPSGVTNQRFDTDDGGSAPFGADEGSILFYSGKIEDSTHGVKDAYSVSSSVTPPCVVLFSTIETSYSYGHGFGVYNENGDVMAGWYTNNPQHGVVDGDGVSQISSGGSYDTWYYYELHFLGDGTYDVYEHNQNGGELQGNFQLRNTGNVKSVGMGDTDDWPEYYPPFSTEGMGTLTGENTGMIEVFLEAGFDTFTIKKPPLVSTDNASNVEAEQAVLNGALEDLDGNSSIDVYFKYRELGASTWNTTSAQTLSSTGSFSETVTGLKQGPGYEFRAVSDDGTETTVGVKRSFITDKDAFITESATNIDATEADLNGTLNSLLGESSVNVYFEYRETGGSTWQTTDKQSKNSTGSFTDTVTGLSEGTQYEFRAVVDYSTKAYTAQNKIFGTDSTEWTFYENYQLNEGESGSLTYKPDNSDILVCGFFGGGVRIIDAVDGSEIAKIQNSTGDHLVNSVAFSADNSKMVFADEKDIVFVSTSDWTVKNTIRKSYQESAFSFPNHNLFTVTANKNDGYFYFAGDGRDDNASCLTTVDSGAETSVKERTSNKFLFDIEYHRGRDLVIAVNAVAEQVEVFDASQPDDLSLQATKSVNGTLPRDVNIDEKNQRIVVTSDDRFEVYDISSNTVADWSLIQEETSLTTARSVAFLGIDNEYLGVVSDGGQNNDGDETKDISIYDTANWSLIERFNYLGQSANINGLTSTSTQMAAATNGNNLRLYSFPFNFGSVLRVSNGVKKTDGSGAVRTEP